MRNRWWPRVLRGAPPVRSAARTIDVVPTDATEQAALIALLERPETNVARLGLEVLERGSAVELLDERVAHRDTLLPTPDATRELIAAAAARLAGWRAAGIDVHTIFDETYPAQLRDIHQAPPVLFSRGQLAEDMRAVAVVGARKASERGLRIARIVAELLVERSITVVSGLATGIDTAAHSAALAHSGRTVAVIGTGVDRVYPADNRELQERIAAQGLVISQFRPGTPPRKEHFPMRNAVMSGYSAATVVVEAGERSGVRIQTRLALQHGRPVILLEDILANEWARSLSDRPGVFVAKDPESLLAAIDDTLQSAGRLLSGEGFPDVAVA